MVERVEYLLDILTFSELEQRIIAVDRLTGDV